MIMRARLLLLPACALALTACTVGPDYVRPDAPAPAAYKELPPNKPARPADTAASRGAWWKIYEDSELDGLQDQVIAANQTLRAAEAN